MFKVNKKTGYDNHNEGEAFQELKKGEDALLKWRVLQKGEDKEKTGKSLNERIAGGNFIFAVSAFSFKENKA